MTSQEKKQYLSQYRYIRDEIADLLQDIEEWRTIAEKTTASYNASPSGVGSADKLTNVVAKIIEIKDKCAEHLERMEQIRQNIEKAIAAVDDVKLKRILRRRYIRGWSFPRIAHDIGYSERQVLRLHGAALREVNEEFLS